MYGKNFITLVDKFWQEKCLPVNKYDIPYLKTSHQESKTFVNTIEQNL